MELFLFRVTQLMTYFNSIKLDLTTLFEVKLKLNNQDQ